MGYHYLNASDVYYYISIVGTLVKPVFMAEKMLKLYSVYQEVGTVENRSDLVP